MSNRAYRKAKAEKIKTEKLTTKKWRDFFDEKFNELRTTKAMLLYTWYLGDSDKLTQAYIEASHKGFDTQYSNVRNSKTYFWFLASKEEGIKRTHSGLPKAIIKTLINILDMPKGKINQEKLENGKISQKSDDMNTLRLEEILQDNDFENLVKQQQEPMTWVMGDGAYIVSSDPSVSDKPIVEFVDSRNTAFEVKANRITKVFTRSYFYEDGVGYCLLQERGLTNVRDEYGSDKRCGYIKYNLFRLTNTTSRDISVEVELDSIKATKNLKPIVVYNIPHLLAVPCIYDYEAISQRGTSIYNEKMDLFDDLDQAISQGGRAVRKSTPKTFIDKSMLEKDEDGKVLKPMQFDMDYVVTSQGTNKVGGTEKLIETVTPQIDFGKYDGEMLALTSQILTGIISPCTIGADVSRKDNAEAQREKEKQTMFTRANLVSMQSEIFKKLFSLVLSFDDLIHDKPVQKYDVVVEYQEYGNPTFDSKLQLLYPAYASKALSPERFIKLLYDDTLTEEEKEKELEFLESNQQVNTDFSLTEFE